MNPGDLDSYLATAAKRSDLHQMNDEHRRSEHQAQIAIGNP
jgi:hypothetical protein